MGVLGGIKVIPFGAVKASSDTILEYQFVSLLVILIHNNVRGGNN